MTVIAASSVRLHTMADGTLRVVADVEPKDAQDAFRLFGSPGTPMALAALRTGAVEAPEPVAEAPKGGPLSEWVALRCKDPEFQSWIAGRFMGAWQSNNEGGPADAAAAVIRKLCGVESRAEIDHNQTAAITLRRQVIEPWKKHCSSKVASGS